MIGLTDLLHPSPAPHFKTFQAFIIIIIIIIYNNAVLSVRGDFNDNTALLYSSSDLYVQPEDGLTGKARNM